MLAQSPPPIPPMDRFGLPGHWAIFLLLYHVTFVLHLLFMNLALGGAIVCLVNDIRGLWSRQTAYLTDLNRRLFLVLPIALSFAITFGVAPLLFVQALYGQFFYTSMILVGLPWLGIIAVLIVVFYLIYLTRFEPSQLGPGWRAARIVIAAAIAASLAGVALVLTSNAVWSIIPDQWLARYHSSLAHPLWPWPPEAHFWPRYAHNLIGGTAMACLLTAGMARTLRHRGVVDEYWTNRTVYGFLLAALGLTGVQMLVGFAGILPLLRGDVREVMLTSTANLHVWGWRLGIAAAIAAVVCMVRGVNRPEEARWPWLALGSMTLTLGGMSMARQAVRAAYLQPHFQLAQWQANITGPTSAMVMFLVSFVLALGIVGWMLWIAWQIKPTIPPADQPLQPEPYPQSDPDHVPRGTVGQGPGTNG